MKKHKLLVLISFFIILICQAQNPSFPEINYENARQLALSGQEEIAMVICDSLLEKNRNNTDVIFLKARILGWKGEYDKSRIILKTLIPNDTIRYEWVDVFSDIEYWDQKYDSALTLVHNGLLFFPDDSLFLAKKKLLESIIFSDTSQIKTAERCIRIQYYFDFFNEMYQRRWHVLSLSSDIILNPKNTVVPKINAGYLSPVSGSNISYALSVESDLYHYSKQNYYLYGNIGFSYSPLFPRIKGGFEYFTPFPLKTEVSVGFRYMRWEHNLYYGTFSLSKYFRDYLFIFRPYFPFRNYETSGAFLFSVRRYIKDIHYVGLSYIFGAAPDQSFDKFLEHGAYHSQKIIVTGNKQLKNGNIFSLSVSYSYEEYSLYLYQNRFDLLLGYNFCF